MMNNDKYWIGKKYGRLEVIGFVRKAEGKGNWLWRVRCDCGREKTVNPSDVKSGRTRSCGCLHKEASKQRATKFKNGVEDNKRLYRIYNWMKRRCYSPSTPRYMDYGGRGICVCNEWLNAENGFDNFVQWALENGYADELSIDRIDVNGNYCPENCRWANVQEQARNKRDTVWVEYNGKKVKLIDLAESACVSYDALHDRIFKRGWEVERAVTTPSQTATSFAQKCREHGISPATARDRIVKFGWDEERALTTPSVGRGASKYTYKKP